MMWLERELVATLISPSLDDRRRAAVEQYVDDSLRSMPEHLRAGVAAESLLFGVWPRLRRALGRDQSELERRIDRMGSSRFDLVRQYVRMLESLVLFAEQEFMPGGDG
jgi:hypothetical protein